MVTLRNKNVDTAGKFIDKISLSLPKQISGLKAIIDKEGGSLTVKFMTAAMRAADKPLTWNLAVTGY